jgi:hypothetical protein
VGVILFYFFKTEKVENIMMIRNTATLLIICLFAASAHAAQVSVEPPYMEVSKGDNFTVDIYVDPDGSEVFGVQYELHFNNALLSATDQTKGTFLSQDGANTNLFADETNNTIGMVQYGEARTGGGGVFTPGILATITFQAIAEEDGISELRLENVKLSDPTTGSIPTNVSNGNVSVRTGVCGDATGDDKVTMADGRRIYMHIIHGVELNCDPCEADVTGDGKITMADGRRIYMHIIHGVELNCNV